MYSISNLIIFILSDECQYIFIQFQLKLKLFDFSKRKICILLQTKGAQYKISESQVENTNQTKRSVVIIGRLWLQFDSCVCAGDRMVLHILGCVCFSRTKVQPCHIESLILIMSIKHKLIIKLITQIKANLLDEV